MKVSVSVLMFSLFAMPMVAQQPRVFLIDPAVLAAQKKHPDAELLKMATAAADHALKQPLFAITDKTLVPPSGDKHDYTSLSRYFWPNPNTPNHLPYIRKDGQSNPEIKNIADHDDMVHIGEYSRALALGYYLTGKEAYADRATVLLRHFFLDPATAMNPNLQYAQFVPGLYDGNGRGSGVLDARWLAYVVDAIGMLHGSKAWTAADQQGMVDWFSKYYVWMRTSKNGKHEEATPNNHGSWYAAQAGSIASFLGKTDDVKAMAEKVRDQRIPSQFDKDGMQKYELVRTNSFSYSAFNLEALTEFAQIAKPTGIDLYKVTPGILTGLDALLPYDKNHKWPHEQIGANMETSICPALWRAGAHTHEAKYAEAETRFDCKPNEYTLLESLPQKE